MSRSQRLGEKREFRKVDSARSVWELGCYGRELDKNLIVRTI